MVVKKGGMVVDTLHKCTCIWYSQICWAWGGVPPGSVYHPPLWHSTPPNAVGDAKYPHSKLQAQQDVMWFNQILCTFSALGT